jgi:hypothetical protein
MKLVAAIYLAIALANFGFWLNSGPEQELFPTALSYLTWSLYFLSLLALLAFILGKLLLPQRLWQVIFAVYLSTRLYELLTRGLVLAGGDIGTDLNIISSYLWLVIPAGLAMWYMGFRFVPSKSFQTQRGAGKAIAHH